MDKDTGKQVDGVGGRSLGSELEEASSLCSCFFSEIENKVTHWC